MHRTMHHPSTPCIAEPDAGYGPMVRKQIAIARLRLDGGTQARVTISTLVVDDYAVAMQQGAVFPPVLVVRDGAHLWLADGFHRVYAAQQLGLTHILADIRPGTLRDAQLLAAGANTQHGLRRTNADKRHAVAMLLHDAEWRHWSDREIARRCGVSDRLVNAVRAELSANDSQMVRTAQRHGTIYAVNTANIGKQRPPAVDGLASLPPDIRVCLADSPLADRPVELEALARLTSPDQQRAVLDALLQGTAQTVRDALRHLAYADKRAVTLQEVLTGHYPVVYADPPWHYSNAAFNGTAAAHYPTMSTEALCALPVPDYVTSNAVLFLWATNPLLEDALTVMRAWGFRYVTNLVWVKDRGTYGKLGFYAHGRHELLLIGVRGSCLPKADCLPDSVLTAKKCRHSEKPRDLYALIERMYDGPYLELFARHQHPGWASFGNEIREERGRYIAPAPIPSAVMAQVLLVEDDADVRELLTLVLSVAGYAVTPVASLSEATAACASLSFAAIVTDYQLPDGTGDQWIRTMRQREVPVAIVLMSALSSVAEVAAACGADAAFAKGRDLAGLLALLATLIGDPTPSGDQP